MDAAYIYILEWKRVRWTRRGDLYCYLECSPDSSYAQLSI